MALIDMDFALGSGEKFPDISDGSSLTIYNNRVTNVTRAYSKKIGNDVYVELEGTLNFSTSGNISDSWVLVSAIPNVTGTSGKKFKICLLEVTQPSNNSILGVNFLNNALNISVKGTATLSSSLKVQAIAYDQ